MKSYYLAAPWTTYLDKEKNLYGFRDCLGKHFATMDSPPGKNQNEATAKLIAAAPELLEACILMYEAWKQLMPNLKNGVVQSYELVLTKAPTACVQAIEKAGEKVER